MPLSDADKIINLEDLAAFKVKMDESVLHKTGDETIEGVKTFQNSEEGAAAGQTAATLLLRNPNVDRGTPVSGGASFTRLIFADSAGNIELPDQAGRLGLVETKSPSMAGGEHHLGLYCYKYSAEPEDEKRYSALFVGYDENGNAYAEAPSTSESRDAGEDIVTRDYLPKSKAIPQFPDMWNWQKTETAGTVAFKPVPESDLEPVVEFQFTDTPPAEGEKGPENPSVIAGVNSATVTHCETEGVDSTDYAISFGGTYYGGSLNVASGVMTVTWDAIALDGTETWTLDSSSTSDVSVFRCSPSLTHVMSENQSASNRVCSHFSYGSTVNSFSTWGTTTRIYIRLPAASYPDEPSLTSWLAAENSAGHPVVISYKVNEAYAVQLTPTQIRSLPVLDKYEPRLNTVHTDQQAVQVGYQRFYDENRLAAIEARLDALEGN